jgi:hypothetical protein
LYLSASNWSCLRIAISKRSFLPCGIFVNTCAALKAAAKGLLRAILNILKNNCTAIANNIEGIWGIKEEKLKSYAIGSLI